jgi:hypothetical protein
MSLDRLLSIAFCRRLKSGTPATLMTTISPSSQAESSPSPWTAVGDRLELGRPVVAVAGEEPHRVAVDARQHAVTVDLVSTIQLPLLGIAEASVASRGASLAGKGDSTVCCMSVVVSGAGA